MSLMKLSIVLLTLSLFCSPSFASKCLRSNDIEELKKMFPVILKGKVLNRKSDPQKKGSFILDIQVVRYIQGSMKRDLIHAKEIHEGNLFPHIYKVGKEYTFLLEAVTDSSYRVVLPGDGCPQVP